MKGIITETTLININESLIREAVNSIKTGQPLIIRGPLQKADEKNRNGRIYAREILEREMNTYQRLVDENRALGELDHPTTPEVNLQNASHLIRRFWWNGLTIEGEVEILNTPAGKIAKQLIASKVPLGISSRGVGSVDDENMVQEDYQLICFDLVSMPSTHGAFLHESKNFGEVKNFVDVSSFLDVAADFLNKY
jgi:hypothetical protein